MSFPLQMIHFWIYLHLRWYNKWSSWHLPDNFTSHGDTCLLASACQFCYFFSHIGRPEEATEHTQSSQSGNAGNCITLMQRLLHFRVYFPNRLSSTTTHRIFIFHVCSVFFPKWHVNMKAPYLSSSTTVQKVMHPHCARVSSREDASIYRSEFWRRYIYEISVFWE